MRTEWKVFYRPGALGGLPAGPLCEMIMPADSEDEARALAESMAGVVVQLVVLHAYKLDWEQQVFTKDEAGEYLRCTSAKIDKLMAAGALPKARNGFPVFTRRMLDECITKHLMVGGGATSQPQQTQTPKLEVLKAG